MHENLSDTSLNKLKNAYSCYIRTIRKIKIFALIWCLRTSCVTRQTISELFAGTRYKTIPVLIDKSIHIMRDL